MKNTDFKSARDKLAITQDEMAIALGDGESRYSVRTVATWESGSRKVPPAVAKLVKIMLRAKGLSI